MATCCYVGRGKVYLQKHGTGCPTSLVPWTTPKVEVGNTESLTFEISENVIEKKDYTSAAGGVECSFSEVESVTLNMDTSCFKAGNLALALFGSTASVAGGAVTDELHFVQSTDDLVVFDKKYDKDAAVVVTSNPAGTTYVLGTDYILTPNGIKLLSTGTITAGSDLLIDYTSLPYIDIQAVTSPSDFYKVIFDGVNANDGSPLYLEIYKVKFTPSSLDFISDEFATVELEANVTKWDCVNATTTVSAYAKVRI